MKKYFLFIPLLMIVFLGLGNVVVAQACLSIAPVPAGTPHVYTCQYPETVPAACNGLGQSCLGASNLQGCGGGTQCCICNYTPPVTESEPENPENIEPVPAQSVPEGKCSKEGEVLKDKDNSKNTTFGCDCVEGFKQVGDKCLDCKRDDVCCGIELNTKVPFIGKCIEDENYGGVSSEKAFPTLMGALTKILVTVILIISFVLIIVGGIMIATGNPSGGKKMIMKVVIGIALLGASGVILRLINPNFFG